MCGLRGASPDHAEGRDGVRSGATQSLFLQAILKGQRRAATTVAFESLRDGNPIQDIYVEVFQESLYQVGRLWESNRITVAEEHMATAITQYVLAQMYPHIPASGTRRGNMVITGVAGELHQVGANMVADVLEAQGYDVRFLGTNMPHGGILQAIKEHEADLLGISTTMLFNIPQVTRLAEEVREEFGPRSPRIVVGGSAFRCAQIYMPKSEPSVSRPISDPRSNLCAHKTIK